MLEGLPKEIEEAVINPDDLCTDCGGKLIVIGKRIVRTEVEYIPAKLLVKQTVQQVGKCTVCEAAGSENPNDHFQKAVVPVPVLPHSIRNSFSSSTYYVLEVCNGDSIQPSRKRLVPAGTYTTQSKHGELGHSMQRRMVDTDSEQYSLKAF